MADPTVEELHAALDVALSQRNRALAIVDKLEAMATGCMTHDQQAAVRAARALLHETGIRPISEPPVWRNRG